jgi:hypothetical protein
LLLCKMMISIISSEIHTLFLLHDHRGVDRYSTMIVELTRLIPLY